MYQIGDLIIYGSTGVCRVSDITMLDLMGDGKTKRYYVINPLYQGGVIYTPTDNEKVFMRPIISLKEVEKLIDSIPLIKAEAYICRESNLLIKHYETVLKSHDCADLIELTMSIHAKKEYMEEQKRKFGAVDEKYMKLAEEVLFGELAAVLNISREEVPEYIAKRLAK